MFTIRGGCHCGKSQLASAPQGSSLGSGITARFLLVLGWSLGAGMIGFAFEMLSPHIAAQGFPDQRLLPERLGGWSFKVLNTAAHTPLREDAGGGFAAIAESVVAS